ncbi:GNAT family N-acetyltransferase [Flindersiella endophytica]
MTLGIELRPAAASEAAAWLGLWEERQRSALTARGLGPADVSERLAQMRRMREEAVDFSVSVVVSGGAPGPVGFAAGGLFGPSSGRYGVVVDLWISSALRRRGYGRAALSSMLSWLRSAGADRALVTLDPADAAQAALFRGGEVNSQRMELRLGSFEGLAALPDGLSWRPMTEAEYPGWLASEIAGFAQENVESGTLPEPAAQARAEEVYASLLPDGLATPDNSLTVLEAAGEPVAQLWLRHHHRHDRSFVYSVVVDEGQRGKGYGRTIMRLGERLSLSAGDHVLGLNVFGHNTAAVGLYTSLGYKATDQSRTILL